MSGTRAIPGSFGFRGERCALRGPIPRDHAHGDLEINLLVGDPATYFLAGRFVELPPARACAFWAALPHRIVEARAPGQLLWVTVPIHRVLDWRLGAGFVRRLFAGELIVDDGSADHLGARIGQWIDELDRGEALHRAAAAEVEAWLRRVALQDRDGRRPSAATAPAHVEDIATYLGERFTEPLDRARLAREVGLSPAYATALFKRATGMTIDQYLSTLRLAHAQRLLATTDRPVLDIALASGFGSQSRFYVAYRRAYGTTPARMRRDGS
jgi:AraC-like DNA-binding protein